MENAQTAEVNPARFPQIRFQATEKAGDPHFGPVHKRCRGTRPSVRYANPAWAVPNYFQVSFTPNRTT
jgi:hypothetical protein